MLHEPRKQAARGASICDGFAGSRGLPRPPAASRGLPQLPAASRGFPRPPGASRGPPGPLTASRGLLGPPTASRGLPGPPGVARGLRPPSCFDCRRICYGVSARCSAKHMIENSRPLPAHMQCPASNGLCYATTIPGTTEGPGTRTIHYSQHHGGSGNTGQKLLVYETITRGSETAHSGA